MARTLRQSKILDIISMNEIETQEELVSQLKAANFDVTQATISRDIKELGLIKILSSDSNRYKYALVDSGEQQASNKYLLLFKEAIISIKVVQNFVLLKTLKGMASSITSIIDKLNVDNVLGSVYGDDTIMVIFQDKNLADSGAVKFEELLSM